MQDSREQLETNDGVDDDDEQHQEGNVEQRHHSLQDRVEHDLETWKRYLT